MPFSDRFWWLKLLLAALVLASAGALAYMMFFWVEGGIARSTFPSGVQDSIGILAAGLMWTLLLAIPAWTARRRQRARLATLRGASDAIPRARTALDMATVPDLSRGPLELRWRLSTADEWNQPRGPVLAVVKIVTGISVVFYIVAQGLIFHHFLPRESLFDMLAPLVLGGVGAIFVIAVILLTIGRFRISGRRRRRASFGIVATEDGVIWQPPTGRERMVRWENARLLELQMDRRLGAFAYEYILYGTDSVAKWSEEFALLPRHDLVPDGISREEMAKRRLELLALIAARTGLVPRTFTRAFQQRDGDIAGRTLRSLGRLLLTGVGALAGLAAAIQFFPLFAWEWANIAVLALLGFSALLTLLLYPRVARLGALSPATAEPYVLLMELPADSPTSAYVLSTDQPPFARVVSRVIGVSLGIVGAIGVVSAVIGISRFLIHPLATAALNIPVACVIALLICAGMVGILLAATLGSSREIHLVASSDGLHMRMMGISYFAAWREIKGLTIILRQGQPEMYSITRSGGQPAMSWFNRRCAGRTAPAGAVAVTPAQLAAQVVARTGVPVEARRITR